MGPDAPRSFTVKESMVLLRGMLPEIPVDASERDVRTHIRDTIKNAEASLSACLLSDFEYVEAHGKNLCVPAQQSDFEWTGRAVKELTGSGSIYVRLTTENADLCRESSDYSVGSPVGSLKEPDVKIIKVEDAGMSDGQAEHSETVFDTSTSISTSISVPEPAITIYHSSTSSPTVVQQSLALVLF